MHKAIFLKDTQLQYVKKSKEIQQRLSEFKNLPENRYIEEFMFCILTPQSNGQRCWQAVVQLQQQKRLTFSAVKNTLKTKTRFHNKKTHYLLEGIKNWQTIKGFLSHQNTKELRDYLAANVKGFGMKEASHFLRNIGKSKNEIAILDRHILKNLRENEIISDERIKNKTHYLAIEEKYLDFASTLNIPPDELDLLWWSKENGEIFK